MKDKVNLQQQTRSDNPVRHWEIRKCQICSSLLIPSPLYCFCGSDPKFIYVRLLINFSFNKYLVILYFLHITPFQEQKYASDSRTPTC